jgi:Flp pilus assembly pilin Flp
MKKVLRQLWEDDAGIVALEYLLVATIVGLGLVVGLASLFEALTVELTELSNAILILDQSYEVIGLTGLDARGQMIGVRRGSRGLDRDQVNSLLRTRHAPASIEVVP